MSRTVLLLGCFAIGALGLWIVLVSLLRPQRRCDIALVASAAIALAPAGVAWICAILLRAFPGASSEFYVAGTVSALLVVSVLFGRPAWLALKALPARRPEPRPARSWLAVALVLIGAMGMIVLTRITPLHENDALEYATVARLISEQKTLSIYPAVDSTKTGGFHGPWTHPAGFPTLLALSEFIQTGSKDVRLGRIPALYAALAPLLLVMCWARGVCGTLAAAVLLGTPLFFMSAINSWIDPVRIASGSAAMVMVFVLLASRPRVAWGGVFAVGVSLGLTFFMHSIGVILTAMACALLLLFASENALRRIAIAAGAFLIALAFVSVDVITNLRNFDAVVADSPPVWRIPELGFSDWVTLGRDLSSWSGKLLNGLLMGFTDSDFYGWSYAIAAVGAVIGLRDTRWSSIVAFLRSPHETYRSMDDRGRILLLSVASIAFWYGCALISTLLGIVEFIKNVRYPYTVQPFVALIAGIGLGSILDRSRERHSPEKANVAVP